MCMCIRSLPALVLIMFSPILLVGPMFLLCLLPSSSKYYFDMPMLNVLGENVNNCMSPGYFSTYDASLTHIAYT